MFNSLQLHNLPKEPNLHNSFHTYRRATEAQRHMFWSYAIEDEFPELDEYGPYKDAYWMAKEYQGPLSDTFVIDLMRTMCGCHVYYRNTRANFGCDPSEIALKMVELCGGEYGVWNKYIVDGWFEDNFEPTYEFLADFHIRFESDIHPFPDGNGRVGRLLLVYAASRADMPISFFSKEAYKKAVSNYDIDGLVTLLQQF